MESVKEEIRRQRKELMTSVGLYDSYKLSVVSNYLNDMEDALNQDANANKAVILEITDILASPTFDEDKVIAVLKKAVAALS